MGPAVLRAQQGDGVRVLLSKVEAALARATEPTSWPFRRSIRRRRFGLLDAGLRQHHARRDRGARSPDDARAGCGWCSGAHRGRQHRTARHLILEIAPVPDGWRVRKSPRRPGRGATASSSTRRRQFHARTRGEGGRSRAPACRPASLRRGGRRRYAAAVLIGRGEMVFIRPRGRTAPGRALLRPRRARTTFQTALSASAPVTQARRCRPISSSPRPSSRRSSPGRARCSTKVSPSRSPSISRT